MPALHQLRDHEWTLPALVAALSPLAAALPGVGDERVSATIDERTLRYFQSSGIVDRPLRYDGRVAVYGYRHLVQALATRALQAQGLSLAQVQAALLGVSTADLERAVAGALGPAHADPQSRAAPVATAARTAASGAPPSPRRLLSAELAPGVTVTVDPSLVPNAESLLVQLASVLHPRSQP